MHKSSQSLTSVSQAEWQQINSAISWADSSCLVRFMSLHSLILSTFFFPTSYPVSMRCWGMSNRHGNPVPGQFSSWEEEEGGDHCGDQGLISAQWHQREGGGLQHHLKRYASPLTAHSAAVVNVNIILVVRNTPSCGEIGPLVGSPVE